MYVYRSVKIFALSIAILLFMICGKVLAVPAAPIVHTLKQADGSTFKAVQWGDEWYHGWETLDGYTILFDEITGNWVYATQDKNGHLVKSNLVVTKAVPRGIPKHLRDLTKISAVRLIREKVISNSVPSSGTIKIPVILINFSDTTPTYSQSDFYDLIFGSHSGTMKDYYREVSYGNLNLTGVILGWYTANNDHDYYGWDLTIPIINYTLVVDAFVPKLVKEAVRDADQVVDFSQFDNDGDGYVDIVIIVHQGTGQEASGKSTDIWSHYSKLSYWPVIFGGGPYKTDDGVVVDSYLIVPEILEGNITTIGVICHEFGHALGLPDLYDTDNSSAGIGDWGLMGSGSWNTISRPGDSPAHLNAWCKWVLGWVHPKKVEGVLANITIRAVEYYDDVYQLLDNPNGPSDWGGGWGEYFLIENRQKVGYDAALPGSGLLIWHIDESQKNNNNENHKLVDLEEADGRNDLDSKVNYGDSGDPFPGLTNNREFDKNTNPNSNLYSGLPSGVSVLNISDSGMIMTATLKVLPAVIAKPDSNSVTAGSELWGNRIVVNPTSRVYNITCVNEVVDPIGVPQKVWNVSETLNPKEIWNVRGYIRIPANASSGTYTYIAIIYDTDTGEELDRSSSNFIVISK